MREEREGGIINCELDIQGSAKHQTQNTAKFQALINLFPFQRYRGCMNKNRVIKKDHKKYRAIDMTYISSFCSHTSHHNREDLLCLMPDDEVNGWFPEPQLK